MPNKAARVGLDLMAGTAGGILGGSAVSNITTMMSDKISDIEDKISGKPIDKNNPNDIRREKIKNFLVDFLIQYLMRLTMVLLVQPLEALLVQQDWVLVLFPVLWVVE